MANYQQVKYTLDKDDNLTEKVFNGDDEAAGARDD